MQETEVIVRGKNQKYPTGFTKWNSQYPIKKETILPIAARNVVETAAYTKNDKTTKRMEAIVKKWDMVIKMPYSPPFFNDEPLIPSYGTQLKDPRSNKMVDSVGAMDLNPRLAYKRTLGEIIERYCQLYPTDNMERVFDNYSNLCERALNPSILFPFENLSPDIYNKNFHWVVTKNLHTQKQTLVPSRSVYLNEDPYDPELDSIRTTNGTAFGYTLSEAIFKGFCEILERDAFFMQYLTKSAPPRIEINDFENEKIEMLIAYFSRYKLEVHLFDISLEFKPHVVMAIIIDRSGIGASIGIGTSCGINPEGIIIKAILEAQQIRLYSRRLNVQNNNKPLNDPLKDRALTWYGKENIEKINFFLNSDRYVALKNGHKNGRDILKEFPHDIYVCDISLPDMSNYKTVKVIIPECLPLYFDETYMPINLQRFKKRLGKKVINNIPHPFI